MKHLLFVGALLGSFGLLGCSDSETPPATPSVPGAPSAAPTSTAEVEISTPEVEVANALFVQLANARKMDVVEPISPAKHFWLQGKIIFHAANGDIEQDSELWLAGPQRMSFQLGLENQHNDFRLFDAEQCWLKVVGGQFEKYDAAELLTETTLRWEVLRFPWGWELPIAEATPNVAEDLSFRLQRTSTGGTITIETDSAGLPFRATLGGSTVTLDTWKMAQNPQHLMPYEWQWKYQAGKRTERFDSIRGRTLFQDSAFHPVNAQGDPVGRLIEPTGSRATPGDDFGVVDFTLHFLNEAEFKNFDGALPHGRWWQAGTQRFFVAIPDQPQSLEGWRSSETTQWLRWATYSNMKAADGIKSLTAIMEQTGYHTTGECWAVEVPDDGRIYRRIFLIPVAKD